ncbi:MAG TPA: hypothetical protein PLQ04_00795 [Lachnospiraceae bacterium]|nr:hypothetical protein [Lachnospiraceae bacterium]
MKKKKLIIILSIIGGFVTIAAVFLILFFHGVFMSPKQKVMLAVSRTFGGDSLIAVISGNDDKVDSGLIYNAFPVSDQIQFGKLLLNAKENASTQDFTLSIEDSNVTYDSPIISDLNAKLTSHSYINPMEQQAFAKFKLAISGISLNLMNLYMDGTIGSMEVPLLYDGYICVDTEDFGNAYNDSDLCELLYSPIPEEYLDNMDYDFWSSYQSGSGFSNLLKNQEETYDAICEFYDSIEVEATGKQKEFTIGDKEENCKEYAILMTSDNLMNLLDVISTDYFDDDEIISEMELDDYTIYVYLDRKGRMVSAEMESDAIDFSLIFSGQQNLCDEFDLEVTLTQTNDGEDPLEGKISLSRTTETDEEIRTDNYVLTFTDSNDQSTKLTGQLDYDVSDDTFHIGIVVYTKGTVKGTVDVTGSLTSTDPGKDATLTVDELTFYSPSDDEIFTVSFEYTIAIAEDEYEEPSGTKYEILKMSEEELNDFVDGLTFNF